MTFEMGKGEESWCRRESNPGPLALLRYKQQIWTVGESRPSDTSLIAVILLMNLQTNIFTNHVKALAVEQLIVCSGKLICRNIKCRITVNNITLLHFMH